MTDAVLHQGFGFTNKLIITLAGWLLFSKKPLDVNSSKPPRQNTDFEDSLKVFSKETSELSIGGLCPF